MYVCMYVCMYVADEMAGIIASCIAFPMLPRTSINALESCEEPQASTAVSKSLLNFGRRIVFWIQLA